MQNRNTEGCSKLKRSYMRWNKTHQNLVTPTGSPKSVRNRCVIELFGGSFLCIVTLSVWYFCWCMWLSPISSFLLILYFDINLKFIPIIYPDYFSTWEAVRSPSVCLSVCLSVARCFFWRHMHSAEHWFQSIHLSTKLEMGLVALKW